MNHFYRNLFFLVCFLCIPFLLKSEILEDGTLEKNEVQKTSGLVYIPDVNFRAYLQKNFASCMQGDYLDPTCTSLLNTIAVYVQNSNISDLTGIEYFKNLVSLDCSNNQLTTLPTLPPSLQILNCVNNKLSSLEGLPSSITNLSCAINPIGHLPILPPKLQELICYQNQLISLPSIPGTLRRLNCSNNQISVLPTLPNSLNFLLASQNKLTSIDPLPTQLVVLDISYNQITSLSSFPNPLISINVSNNLISVLPVVPSNLQVLNCNNNNLTYLPDLPSTLLDFNCSSNQLTNLPELPTNLTSLGCASNNITSIPTLPLNLGYLTCSNNQLTSLPPLPSKITNLFVANNKISSIPQLPLNLNNLDCSNNQLSSLPTLPNKLCLLICNGNNITCLPNIPTCSSFLSSCGNTACFQITSINVSVSSFCPGYKFKVFFTITSPFDADNEFTAELSDANGNFDNPITVGYLDSPTEGTIYCQFPDNLPAGSGYKIRVSAYSPSAVSPVSGNLTCYAIPTPIITGGNQLCANSKANSYSTDYNPNNTYTWTISGGLSNLVTVNPASILVDAGTSPGQIQLTVSNTFGCTPQSTSINLGFYTSPYNVMLNGSTTVCENQQGVTYSTTPSIGSTFTWSVPTGTTIVSGQGTNSIVVNMGANSGPLTFIEKNIYGCIGYPITYNLTVTPLPRPVISGPTGVCLSQQNVPFSVSNPDTNTSYAWTVPSDATITSGQGTSSIQVNWGTSAGNVSVVGTSNCGKGFLNTLSVSLTSGYALRKTDVFCGANFCIPFTAIKPISNATVGIDFTILYNPSIITPTGIITPGPAATPYSSYSINTATSGKIYVSLYLVNAPAGVYMNGIGDIACIGFKLNNGITSGASFTLSTESIEESSPLNSTIVCNALPTTYTVIQGIQAKVTYRNSTKDVLSYDPSNPTAFIPTTITTMDPNCTTTLSNVMYPDINGTFLFNRASGNKVKLQRDVYGDLSVPAINCTNVQNVINSSDSKMAADIAAFKPATLYQLWSADVNMDGKVTSGDAYLISQRSINANNCEFPQLWNYTINGNSLVPSSNYQKSIDWIFIDNVSLASPIYSTFSRNSIPPVPPCPLAPAGTPSCNPSGFTVYQAILLGDVNGNWTASYGNTLKTASSNQLILAVDEAKTNYQGNWIVPVYYATEDNSFEGMDFSLDYDGLQVINVTSNTASNPIKLEWNTISNQRIMATGYSDNTITTSAPIAFLELNKVSSSLKATDFSNATAYVNDQPASVSFAHKTTGINAAINNLEASVFPNPTKKEVFVFVNDEAAFVKVSVTNINGVIIYEEEVPSNQNSMLNKEFEPGIYFIKITGSKGTETKKLIKQ